MKVRDINIKLGHWYTKCKQEKMLSRSKYHGKNIYLCSGYHIDGVENVEVYDNVWIGRNCYISGVGGLIIKSGTIISHNVEIWTANHNYDGIQLESVPYDSKFIYKQVVINENVWIGSRVIVVPGVTIGEGAVIGAGTVVRSDIPALAVACGNPARIIKYRDVEKYNRLKEDNMIYLKMNYNYDISPNRIKR